MSIRLQPNSIVYPPPVDGGALDIGHLLRRLHLSTRGDATVALLSERLGVPQVIGVTPVSTDVEALSDVVREVAIRCASAVRNDSASLVARYDFEAKSGGALAISVRLDNRTEITVVMLRLVATKFDEKDERALRRVGNWVADHLKLWWHLQCTRRGDAGTSAALDMAGEAIFVLDREAKLLRANATARQILDVGDGLRATGDTLTTTNLDDSVRLHAAISQAVSLGPSTGLQQAPVLSVQRKDRCPIAVAVLRSAITGNSDEPLTIVLLAVDPETNLDAALTPACRLYRLTETEARLTLLLVGGASLGEAAVTMRVLEPTARSYLKQVFAKLGINRQAELTRLILTSIVRTGPGVVQQPLQ